MVRSASRWRAPRPAPLVLLAVVAAPLALAAAAQADFYNPAAGCINRAERGDYSVVARDPDGKWESLGTAATTAEARVAADLILGQRIWLTWNDRFRVPPLGDVGPDGRRLPFQVFSAPGVFSDPVTGALVSYCGPPAAFAVILRPGAPRGDLAATLWHEGFHAFQYGLDDDPPITTNWWHEATATWGEETHVDSGVRGERDEAFLQRPRVALDDFAGGEADLTRRRHPYGAWRFVQWLERELGETRLWSLMIASFRRTLDGAEPTAALREELDRARRELGTELGRFWGEHLRPEPGIGPAVRGRRERIDPARDPDRHGLDARPLTAEVLRFRLPADSGVERIEVRADAADGGGKLWVLVNERPEDWSSGGSAAWCADGMTGFRWPGQLPAALTGAAQSGSARARVEFLTSAAPCRCPPSPRRFDEGEGHTEYYVFGQRFEGVSLDLGDWLRALARERRRLSRRGRLQRGAHFLRCAAGRARDISPVPDSRLRTWRNRWAASIRAAAEHFERGRLGDFQSAFTRAGRNAVLIATRVTVKDLECGPARSRGPDCE